MGRRAVSWRAAVALAAGLTLAGCATSRPPPPGELEAVPFFPQEAHQCGPSALATVLAASGVAITPEALAPEVYLPGRRGSLQAELIASSRRHERLPYVIEPSLEALAAEVAAGRPVLVLQNLGLRRLPRWHYAVVVAVSPQRIVLRSGRHARLVMSRRAFLRTWARADAWGLVVLRPGELPALADATRWLRANAALEEIGRLQRARDGYALATQRWPEERLAWIALGNADYRLGDASAAEAAWRRALALAPDDAIVHNNLAQVLIERGCREEALTHIEAARRMAAPELRASIEATARASETQPGGAERKKSPASRGFECRRTDSGRSLSAPAGRWQ